MPGVIAPAAANRGQRHVALETSAQLVPDHLPTICRWNPYRGAFVTALRMMRKTRTVENRRYDLWEMRPPAYALTVLADNGSTSITVSAADAKHVPDFALLYSDVTKEVFRVTAVNTTTGVLTVSRAWGSFSGATLTAGQQLVIGASAYPDGGRDGTAIWYAQENGYNYVQIHKTSVEASRRAQGMKRYGGWRTMQDDRVEAGLVHKEQIEEAILFGRRHLTTDSDGKEVTSTGGLYHFINSNYNELGGARPDFFSLVDMLEPIYRYGEGSITESGTGAKHALCSPAWISYWTKLMKDMGGVQHEVLQLSDPEKGKITLGWRVAKIIHAHGELYLHRMQRWAQAENRKGMMIVTDPNHLRLAYFVKGGTTHTLTDRQETDRDGDKDTILTDCGIDLEIEGAHGVFERLG